jgi:hypothetical protein
VLARDRWTATLLRVVPIIFAVPVLWGIAISVVRLLGTPDIDLGWATTVNSDGEAVYLGLPLHQDPSDGYTGQLYTPLFPTVVGALNHLALWTPWPLLLAITASLVLVALAARLAFVDPGGQIAVRALVGLGALGVGALGWWLVSALELPLLYEARADQFAWALALGGLLATARIGAARGLVLAIALLSLAFWAKQNTISVSVAAVAWVGLRCALGALPWRRLLWFGAGMVVVNLVVLGILNVISSGWRWELNFVMPSRHAVTPTLAPWIREGLVGMAPAIAFCVGMGIAAAVALPRGGGSVVATLRAGGGRRRVAELLVMFIPIGFALAVYFRRKQGGADNQFLGVTWALVLLGAAWWATAQRRVRGAAVAATVVLAGFALTQIGSFERFAAARSVRVPPVKPAATWGEVPPDLRVYARSHLLYHPVWSDLNVRKQRVLYPNFFNFADLLAAGRQPMYLVNAFLDRRFDGVTPFNPFVDGPYSSAFGKWEENYTWKLNQVIAARYAAAPGMPAEVLARRPGPERDAWMRTCFAPFRAGGVEWRIWHGGGFWCQSEPDGPISMRGTPAPDTELRATERVAAVAGRLRLRLPRGWAELRATEATRDWTLRAEADPRGLIRLTVVAGDVLLSEQTARPAADGTVTAELAPQGSAALRGALTVPPGPAELSLVTSADGGLVADLGALRLR